MSVDSEAYKPPSRYSSLYSSNLRSALTETSRFNDLPQIAEELDFKRVTDIPTRKAVWQIYNRPNYDVPNFPDGSTRTSSHLAVYDTEGELTHAILRASEEPYRSEEFTKDLAVFTKYYIERPRILGFPSQELSSKRNVAISLVAGIALGSITDYYTFQSMPGSLFNWGTDIGMSVAPIVYGTLWGLSEMHASRQIANPEQYVTGNQAQWTLEGERSHNIHVALQKELYQALQLEGINLSPDQFLEKIYKQIPEALFNKRHEEIEQSRYPKLDSPSTTEDSLPQLIEVSHVLQSVESYLQKANELKQSLTR